MENSLYHFSPEMKLVESWEGVEFRTVGALWP